MTEFFVLIVNVRAGPALGHSLIHWIWRHELGVSLSSQSGDFHLTIGAVDLDLDIFQEMGFTELSTQKW